MSGLHDDMPLMDSILMHMGSIYANLGKFEDAMLVYERGLKILEKEFGKLCYSTFLADYHHGCSHACVKYFKSMHNFLGLIC